MDPELVLAEVGVLVGSVFVLLGYGAWNANRPKRQHGVVTDGVIVDSRRFSHQWGTSVFALWQATGRHAWRWTTESWARSRSQGPVGHAPVASSARLRP